MMVENFVKKLFLLIIVLFLFGCSSSKFGQFFDREITVYPVSCNGEIDAVTNICNGKPVRLSKRTYKVSSRRQEVMYWLPNLVETPKKLQKCIVRDSKNWHCGDYISGITAMEEGHLMTPHGDGIFYVSKWRWWYLKIMGGDSSDINWYGGGEKDFWDSVLVTVAFWIVIIIVISSIKLTIQGIKNLTKPKDGDEDME